MSSDDRLVRRAAKGDSRAFEAIYNRYHQDLYRFCLAMLGNPQDAQDTLQNTMVKVLRALPGEERRIQLRPWLYRIARNESVETLRKRRDSEELDPESELGAVAGVAETAETRGRLRALIADLEELPPRQRAALVMRELAGLEFSEIADAFDTSPAVARQTLYEARLSLRQLEEGREMGCADVMKELSDADGRVTRRRQIRAHLGSCADCRAFRDSIIGRRKDLAAIAPLPLAASAGLLQAALGGGAVAGGAAGGAGAGAGAGAGVAATVSVGAGKAVATSAVVKSVATVAVAAVVGVSAADRSGMIDLPPVGNSETSEPGARQGAVAGRDRATAENVDASRKPRAEPLPERGAKGSSSPGGRPEAKDREEKGPRQSDNSARSDGPSPSQAGLAPPGGGYGRSASERRGRPESPPDAAARGRNTANSRKPAKAGSPQQSAGTAGKRAKAGSSSPAKPARSPKSHAPLRRPPPQPPAMRPPQAQNQGTGPAGPPPPAER